MRFRCGVEAVDGFGEDREMRGLDAVHGVEVTAGEQARRADLELPDAVDGVAVRVPREECAVGGVEGHELVAADGVRVGVALDVAVGGERRVGGVVEEQFVLDIDEVAVAARPDGVAGRGDRLEVAGADAFPDEGAVGGVEGLEGVAARAQRACSGGVHECAVRLDFDLVDRVRCGCGPGGVDGAGVGIEAHDIVGGGAVDLRERAGHVQVVSDELGIEDCTGGACGPGGQRCAEVCIDGASLCVDFGDSVGGHAVDRGEPSTDPDRRAVGFDGLNRTVGIGRESVVQAGVVGVDLGEPELVDAIDSRESTGEVHVVAVGRYGDREDLRGVAGVGDHGAPVRVDLARGDVDRCGGRLSNSADGVDLSPDVVAAVRLDDGPDRRLDCAGRVVGRVDRGDSEDASRRVVGSRGGHHPECRRQYENAPEHRSKAQVCISHEVNLTVWPRGVADGTAVVSRRYRMGGIKRKADGTRGANYLRLL